jgi:hypothetical protein
LEESSGPKGQLFFSSPPKDAALVLGLIVHFHLTTGKDWSDLTRYVHGDINKLKVG